MDDIELDELSRDEIISWKHHPITRLLIKGLKGDLEFLRGNWEDGVFIKDTVEETALVNVKVFGQVSGILSIFEWLENLGVENDNSNRV
jgi:hypothetical protein